ncbi:MAG: primosomal protein N' [candidate division Zixibacteria bacterium]|nr:primosomal protein N' [candidate division Zixibacteria bacterium]
MKSSSGTSNSFAAVAVTGPRRLTFTYAISSNHEMYQPGQRLLVPFGRSRRIGFYLGPTKATGDYEIKQISKVIDPFSLFTENMFSLCMWIADYYFANPANCLAAALPSLLKTSVRPRLEWKRKSNQLPKSLQHFFKPGKQVSPKVRRAINEKHPDILKRLIIEGAIEEQWSSTQKVEPVRVIGYRCCHPEEWSNYFSTRKINPRLFDDIRTRAQLLSENWTTHYINRAIKDGLLDPVLGDAASYIPDILTPRTDVNQLTLNNEQKGVIDEIIPFTTKQGKSFQTFLLHGVTGSGKTLVYCHLAREVLKTGRTVLIMAPEIALTGVVLSYFRGFFGDSVTVLHSGMTDRERLDSFNGLRQGKYRIAIGPRSALFAPLDNLGLIVVDEEHDSSYKQSNPSPRFHGRDCAIMRARIEGIPVLLGSASPSIESYYRALQGKYKLLEMTNRPAGASLPKVRIIDMKSARLGGDLPFFSFSLKKEIDERLKHDEQTILFLNRRGYSPQLKCSACGYVPTCPNCQIKLTYHQAGRKLVCHYCGHTSFGHDRCPSCGSDKFIHRGAGTQKVEEAISRLFPEASVVRLDSDTASGRKRMRDILRSFASHKSNVLLGTQMVTKGLDLPSVTLVGVLSADLLLDMPDFRASERTFAQLLQVAGRSGRSDKPGEVLIQTYYPDNDIISYAASQDYQTFFKSIIKSREDLFFPPFSRLVNIIFSSKDEKKLEKAVITFRNNLKQWLDRYSVAATLLGPAPCPLHYLRKNFRRNLLIKTNQVVKLTKMLTVWESNQARFGLPTAIKTVVDVDPDDMM